jgi:mercuric ion transport protein
MQTKVRYPMEDTVRSTHAVTGMAAGGLFASLLASSCCILPLALVSVGVSGSWMSTLTSLAPYQPYFVSAAVLLIGLGLRQAYKKPVACQPGTLCANPAAGRITKSVLWAGGALALAALGVDIVAPFFV